jgi:hypothetical protein
MSGIVHCASRLHETFRFSSVSRSRAVGRTPWTGDQLVHKHRKPHTQHKHLNIHALSGIQTYGPGVTNIN